MWIVSVGDPFNGLTLYGLFDTHTEAFDWADDNPDLNERIWTIVRVQLLTTVMRTRRSIMKTAINSPEVAR